MSNNATKYTEEEMNAMRISAMLQGMNPDDIQNQLANAFEDEEDFDIEIIDEEKPKKKRKSTSKIDKVGSEKQEFTTKLTTIPELPEFENVKRNLSIPVTLNSHDIHYKEQYWGIPTRTLNYMLEIVKIPKVAKDISNIMNASSEEERNKAVAGEVRYFKIVNYDENVPYTARELGYIKLSRDKQGRLKARTHLLHTALTQNRINEGTMSKQLASKTQELIS
jgi:hypothetical protein